MFEPYFIDNAGRRHTFQDDFALKKGLVRAWRKGGNVFGYKYRLKSTYTSGRYYELDAMHQTKKGIIVGFVAESALGREVYCI